MAPHNDSPPESGKHKSKKIPKSQKIKQRPVDYAERPSDGSSGNDTRPPKPHMKQSNSSKPTKTRPKDTNHQAQFKKPSTDVDANAIPNPAPDTGFTTSYPGPAWSEPMFHTGILPAVPPSSTPAITSGFSPLPPFQTVYSSMTTSMAQTTWSSQSTPSSTQPSHGHTSTGHLSSLVVALVSVGSFLFLLAVTVAVCICTSPRKRTHPTPSLPILQDSYPERKVDADEESLFGGNERSSARPNSNGVLWPWTQYSRPQPPQADTSSGAKDIQTKHALKRVSVPFDEKMLYPFSGYGTTTTEKVSQTQTPLQSQLQSAITRAANRVSAMSMSIYPNSPQSPAFYNIGVAVGGASPLAADGQPVLQRSNSKASNRRYSKVGKTSRQSMAFFDDPIEEDSYIIGDMATAPTKSGLTTSNSVGNRARVKPSYTPASALRTSTSVSALSTAAQVPESGKRKSLMEASYILPPLPPITKSDERRERDTKALTSALGLASPPPPPSSPQGTLYPDDSITLAGDRRRSRAFSHGRNQSQVGSPVDPSSRLGNLMLADFQSMASLPSTRTVAPTPVPTTATRAKVVTRKRADDKPPRVPSPPPLPSLAQMAMAHTNPDGYSDYRSPTFSIYGLYETDRKSRVPGQGDY